MKENPFSYSDLVTGEAFCNRKQEQKDLIYYAQNSQNVLLFSNRRMGKTSLIHQVIQRLKKTRPKIRSIYIDLYGTLDEKDFIVAVFNGFTQIESRLERVLKLAAGLKVSGTLDPITGQPSVSVTIDPTERPLYLQKAMQTLASFSEKQKLLVIFDEFQETAKYSEPGFEKRLRSFIQRHTRISYLFSGSQKHILSQMFNSSDRAFYQLAQNYPLRKIEAFHYIKWAKGIFKKRNIEIEEGVIADVIDRCDAQPMYIQQFLFELWRLNKIGSDAIKRIEVKILSRRLNEFIILWDSLTPNQRKALRLVAKTGGKGVFNADSLQSAGFRSGSVMARALSSLVDREIIHKNRGYDIPDAMLKKWIVSL